jgi:hypothetical protein
MLSRSEVDHLRFRYGTVALAQKELLGAGMEMRQIRELPSASSEDIWHAVSSGHDLDQSIVDALHDQLRKRNPVLADQPSVVNNNNNFMAPVGVVTTDHSTATVGTINQGGSGATPDLAALVERLTVEISNLRGSASDDVIEQAEDSTEIMRVEAEKTAPDANRMGRRIKALTSLLTTIGPLGAAAIEAVEAISGALGR